MKFIFENRKNVSVAHRQQDALYFLKVSISNGFHFSTEHIKNVNVGIFKDEQWEYHILTEDSSEIDKLLVDIKDNWITNMKRVPQEEWVDINFDDDYDFGAMSYKVRYYPKSDTLLFNEYKNLEIPNEVMSITSSKYLKELLRRNGFSS